jgi:hypothetical protein
MKGRPIRLVIPKRQTRGRLPFKRRENPWNVEAALDGYKILRRTPIQDRTFPCSTADKADNLNLMENIAQVVKCP